MSNKELIAEAREVLELPCGDCGETNCGWVTFARGEELPVLTRQLADALESAESENSRLRAEVSGLKSMQRSRA